MPAETAVRARSRQIDTDVVIVGAGPAGLAVGACLRKRDVPFIILERNASVGSSWRRHYDRLHLHTDKGRSSLPHLPFPRHYPRYPSRIQVIEYLESYTRHFSLEPHFGQNVERAYRENDRWHTITETAGYRSHTLVVATGFARVPVVPAWPDQSRFQGPIPHSSRYTSGRAFVVGFGNSGGEIAIDLWEHGAQPALCVRSPVNVIPRDLFGLPLLAISIPLSSLPARLADLLTAPILRWKFGDLTTLGLEKASYGAFTEIENDARIPLIDVGTIDLLRKGKVTVHPAIQRFGEQTIVFENDRAVAFDAVVLATGYRPDIEEFLPDAGLVTDARGIPQTSGSESAMEELYFCGFHVSARGVLNDIAHEARQIARDIAP